MARANANRLCPQVNAYAEAPILPSDGHTQMPVAASSLGMLTWGGGGGGHLPPPARLPRTFAGPHAACCSFLAGSSARWPPAPGTLSSLPSASGLRLVLQPSLRPGPAPLPPSQPCSGCPHLPPGPRLSSLPSGLRSLPSRTSAR